MDNPEQRGGDFDDAYQWQDDYTELHLEDATYGDFDWDTLDAALVERHDAILEMNVDALDALDIDKLDPFHQWAAARAWLQHKHPARFITIATALADTPADKRSKLLSTPDIALTVARALAAEGKMDDAMARLESYRQMDDADAVEHARHLGLLLLEDGQTARGLDILLDALQNHKEREPELGLHLAEDLHDLGHDAQARAVLQAARDIASDAGNQELLQEIVDTLDAYAESDDTVSDDADAGDDAEA